MTDENLVRKHRPYEVMPSSYRGLSEIVGRDGQRFGSHWSSPHVAQQFADALNGNGPGPGDPVTADQAHLFLDALWPKGEGAYLSCHARTYLQAFSGVEVPKPFDGVADRYRKIASALRAIADGLDQCAVRDPF